MSNNEPFIRGEKRIVGCFSEYETKDITRNQLKKLTHALFSHIEMNFDGTLRFKTENALQRFSSLESKSKEIKSNLKVMISIGGNSNSEHFSKVVADAGKRRTFISSIMSFVKEHQIDGVDILWKWPAESEKSRFVEFLKELRESLKDRFVLSIGVPPPEIEQWEAGLDLDGILDFVDFVNVYSMNYYGPWDNQWGTPAGPSAPLYSGVGARKNFNVDYTIQYYANKTDQLNKFNIVIPFYARFWKHVKDLVEPGKKAFRNVELLNNRAYGNYCLSRSAAKRDGWILEPNTWDEASKCSYIYNPEDETYLTFETEESIIAKLNFVDEKNLGGVWISSVDLDDDRNTLLNAVFMNA